MAQSFQPSNIIEFNGNQHKDVFFNGYEHKEAWMDINGELCCVWKRTSSEYNHVKIIVVPAEYQTTTSFISSDIYIAYDKVVFPLYGLNGSWMSRFDIATVTVDFTTDSIDVTYSEDSRNTGSTRIGQNFWSIGTETGWDDYDKIVDKLNGDLILESSIIVSGGFTSWAYPRGNPPRRESSVRDDSFAKLGLNGYRINTAVNHTLITDSVKLHNDETSLEAPFNYFALDNSIGSESAFKSEKNSLGLSVYVKNNHLILYSNGNTSRHTSFYWSRLCKYDPLNTGYIYDYYYNGIYMGYPYKGEINLNTGNSIYYLQYGNHPKDTYYDNTTYYEDVIDYDTVVRDFAVKTIRTFYYIESESQYYSSMKRYLVKYGTNLNSELKTWDISDITYDVATLREISRPNNTTSVIVYPSYYVVNDEMYTLESLPSETSVSRTVLGYAYSEILDCDYVLVSKRTFISYSVPDVYTYECYKLVEGKYILLNVDFSSLLEAEAETGFHGGVAKYANGFWYFINETSARSDTTIMRFNIPELNVYKGE